MSGSAHASDCEGPPRARSGGDRRPGTIAWGCGFAGDARTVPGTGKKPICSRAAARWLREIGACCCRFPLQPPQRPAFLSADWMDAGYPALGSTDVQSAVASSRSSQRSATSLPRLAC